MDEKQNSSFQLCFNGFLKVDSQGSRVTSDGGSILVRELDEHLGMSQLIEQHLTDPRGTNRRLSGRGTAHFSWVLAQLPATRCKNLVALEATAVTLVIVSRFGVIIIRGSEYRLPGRTDGNRPDSTRN